MKGSFSLTFRYVLPLIAMAIRLRRASIEKKIASFKIQTNFLHNVLSKTSIKIRRLHKTFRIDELEIYFEDQLLFQFRLFLELKALP